MEITRSRRAMGMGAVALSGMTGGIASSAAQPPLNPVPAALPLRNEFTTGEYEVCLNNARWHPMSKGSRQAIVDYLDYKQRGIWTPPDQVSASQHAVKEAYAKLIHADISELAYVNSTT